MGRGRGCGGAPGDSPAVEPPLLCAASCPRVMPRRRLPLGALPLPALPSETQAGCAPGELASVFPGTRRRGEEDGARTPPAHRRGLAGVVRSENATTWAREGRGGPGGKLPGSWTQHVPAPPLFPGALFASPRGPMLGAARFLRPRRGSESRNYYQDGLRRAMYIQPGAEERRGPSRPPREPRFRALSHLEAPTCPSGAAAELMTRGLGPPGS